VPAQAATSRDMSYRDAVEFIDNIFDAYQTGLSYDQLIKPWFDVWLPDSTVEQFVGSVIPTLTERDIGPTGFWLLFPYKRSTFTRSYFRVPDEDWVYLFDILTSSKTAGPDPTDPTFVSDMLARNRRLYEQAVNVQAPATPATRYIIGSIPFTHDDWVAHYGPVWPAFQQAKQKYDPDGIMTPGPGIFSG
jgi:FAD/FMN-containing dehydrogenase